MGFHTEPLGLTPLPALPDPRRGQPRAGRFDDPRGEYRILYAARWQRVALRESLQNFRRDSRELAVLLKTVGLADLDPPEVEAGWLATRTLAEGVIRCVPGRSLADLESPELRRKVLDELASYLALMGLGHLDIADLRSKLRPVTQAIGRLFYEKGHAGVVFRSNLPPGGICVALFEGRSWLEASGRSHRLQDRPPALRHVAKELGLALPAK